MTFLRKISDFIGPGDGMLQDSDYPEDMGRNDTYELRPSAGQFLNVYLTQMKLYSKDVTTYAMYLFVLAIPLIAFSGILDGFVFETYLERIGDTGETYAALCLGLLSLMMALIASVICGNIIPNEFRSRTAYLNLPFPQSRGVFFFGKFLAGLTVVMSIVIAALSAVIFIASWKYGTMSSTAVIQASAVALAGTFAFCATAYGISAFLSRSSTMLPFIIIFMILPMIGLLLSNLGGVSQYIGYIPCFSGDVALNCLGSHYSVSTSYLFSDIDMLSTCKPAISVGASILWGIIFLLIGFNRISRREM